MALRGKVPSIIQKRLKMLVFGQEGSGKTMNSLMFPSPYLIDTERGAENDQYIKILESNGGVIFQSSDFEDVYREVYALGTEKHEYKTLIIDPITIIHNKLVEDCASNPKIGEARGRHYIAANKRMQSFINLLLRLDMNIIITAHSKNEYAIDNAVLDKTFDGYKKLGYLFDLLIEINIKNKDRIAIVRKSRVESFPVGDQFVFSYDEIKKRYKGKSLEEKSQNIEIDEEVHGIVKRLKSIVSSGAIPEDVIEKILDAAGIMEIDQIGQYPDKARALLNHWEGKYGHEMSAEKIERADHETIKLLKSLMTDKNIDEETYDKWLSKANVSCIDEFTQEQAEKAIAYLEGKV